MRWSLSSGFVKRKIVKSIKKDGQDTLLFFDRLVESIKRCNGSISKLSLAILLSLLASDNEAFSSYLKYSQVIERRSSVFINPFIFKKMSLEGKLKRNSKEAKADKFVNKRTGR